MRLSRYGWTEAQALTNGRYVLPRPRAKERSSRVPRPGAKTRPVTNLELSTLRLLAEGETPRQIVARGLALNLHALHRRIDRLRLKLGALTTAELMVRAVRAGLV